MTIIPCEHKWFNYVFSNNQVCMGCGAERVKPTVVHVEETPVSQTLRNQTKRENVPGIKALSVVLELLDEHFEDTERMTVECWKNVLKDAIVKLRSERHGNV